MPWWGWVLIGFGALVLLAVAWFAIVLYLLSKGDTE